MKKLLFLFCLIPSSALASGTFDGNWAISIHTQRGTCDPLAYAYVDVAGTTVRIHNSFSGTKSRDASGLISKAGNINATVQGIRVRGKLGSRTGSGFWNSPEKNCSGVWSAANRS
jgi:hypothetical protein